MVKSDKRKQFMLKNDIQFLKIDDSSAGQRVDNFLFKTFKDLPKSHIYKIIRSGEIRINKKRVKNVYRLQFDDVVRIPPIVVNEKINKGLPKKINISILFEDEWFIVIDKPSGLAVHGGSGINFGLIETLRNQRKDCRYLELVHRLDKNTSGVILIAKKRSALRELQAIFRSKQLKKYYFVGVSGVWRDKKKDVSLYLKKTQHADGNHVRVVDESDDGKLSRSIYYLEKVKNNFSLLSVNLITGRTHQIRVQLSYEGYPVLGDDKYGDFVLNKSLKSKNLKRMFLHASKISFTHPFTQNFFECASALPKDLELIFQWVGY